MSQTIIEPTGNSVTSPIVDTIAYDFKPLERRSAMIYPAVSEEEQYRKGVSSFEKNTAAGNVINRDVILNEHFESYNNVQAKIIGLGNDLVQCLCLVDLENRVFKQKAYPRILFALLGELKLNQFVLISIKFKAGSIRHDLYPGDQFVNKSLFDPLIKDDEAEVERIWKEIDTKKFMKPMNYRAK